MTKIKTQLILDRLMETLKISDGRAPAPFPGGLLPCTETSDCDKLCKNPLVSVHFLTFNHEKWIAEAIESVVRQQCTFEFELIIGEDCSTDHTREVCFEYQRKYPNIIRVLHSDKNVGASINSVRILQHVRGEYIAFLEGDDYWCAWDKLERQIQVFIENKQVNLCASRASCRRIKWGGALVPPQAFATCPTLPEVLETYLHTSTYVARTAWFLELRRKYQKDCYDYVLLVAAANTASLYFLDDVLSVNRQTGWGIWTGLTQKATGSFDFRLYRELMLFVYPNAKNEFIKRLQNAWIQFSYAGDVGIRQVLAVHHFFIQLNWFLYLLFIAQRGKVKGIKMLCKVKNLLPRF